MPSSADAAFGSALAQAAEEISALLATIGAPAPIVLIDGRSGSGKSTLAGDLVRRSEGRMQLVALDDLYPGWDGLAAGADEALHSVIAPHAAGRVARWRRWDWSRDARAEEHRVDPDRPLLVEGAGVLTPATAALAQVAVWIESPTSSRRRRALDRDGDTYRPHWDRWAAQEAAHLVVHRPADHATVVVATP